MTRVGIGGERGPGGAESGGQGAQVAVALAGAEQRPGGRRGGRRAGHGEGTGRPGAASQRAFRAVGRSLMSLSEKGSRLRIFEQEDDMIRRLTQNAERWGRGRHTAAQGRVQPPALCPRRTENGREN